MRISSTTWSDPSHSTDHLSGSPFFHGFLRSPRKFFLASNLYPSCYCLSQFWFSLAPEAVGWEAEEFCWIQTPSTLTSFLRPSYLPLLGEDLLIIQPPFSPDITEGRVREIRSWVSLRRSIGIFGSAPAIQGLQQDKRGQLKVAPAVPASQEPHGPLTAIQAWRVPVLGSAVLCGFMSLACPLWTTYVEVMRRMYWGSQKEGFDLQTTCLATPKKPIWRLF